jgi:hypothetical protein
MSDSIDLTVSLTPETHAARRVLAAKRATSEHELAVTAIQIYLKRVLEIESPIGLLRQDPEVLDAVTAEAFEARYVRGNR